ncbi:threonine aldolase family protein [Parasediminibacterium sp. JCM 36343]|uniref:threonine aldolase family protein n=1 Tax=Parasediminibacterium sp. JCM 36343 TaxID=3374279 RepID=UPI003979D56F
MTIDLRSDTVTQPNPTMLDTMLHAKLGDDVFGEDPTVNELEAMAASMFGMEAGLFCPSGTMTNQIAIKVHTQPGDEVICDKLSHIYQYEGGGIAFNSGCSVHLIDGDRGRISAEQVKAAINDDADYKASSKLVSVENTTNRGGGSCYDFKELIAIKEVCLANNLSFHLDGARLFNAIVANNESPKQYGEVFDSISICLSKGLGTPVGSVLLGTSSFIKKARRVRKVFGGGMRQAGILAAAGVYALENNISRLAIDHENAKKISAALAGKDFAGNILSVDTNIIIAEIKERHMPATFVAAMKELGIFLMAISPTQIRMVLHLGITREMVDEVVQAINNL